MFKYCKIDLLLIRGDINDVSFIKINKKVLVISDWNELLLELFF